MNQKETKHKYASTSSRFLAGLIDSFIVLQLHFSLWAFAVNTVNWFKMPSYIEEFLSRRVLDESTAAEHATKIHLWNPDLSDPKILLVFLMTIFICHYLYFSLSESSKFQGTLAKKLTQIKVVNSDNKKLSWQEANLRYWLKLLCLVVLPFSFIISIVRADNKMLHDLMSKSISSKEELPETSKLEKTSYQHANFIRRLGALIIDTFVLLGASIFSSLTAFSLILYSAASWDINVAASKLSNIKLWWNLEHYLAFSILNLFFLIIIAWSYYAITEASFRQASIGKAIFGLTVVNKQYQRLNFNEASKRFFMKLITILSLGLGFLRIPFVKSKQALHDKLSGSYLVKQVSLCLIVILVGTFSNACQVKHEDLNNETALYSQAQELMNQYTGNSQVLTQAYNTLERIRLLNSNSEYYYSGMGRLSYKNGFLSSKRFKDGTLAKAESYLEKALEINPDFLDAHLNLTYVHIFNQDPEKAKAQSRIAKKIDPESPKVPLVFADIASDLDHDHEAALKYCKKGLSRDPDIYTLGRIYTTLVDSYAELGKIDLADSYYNKLLELEPKSPWTRINYSHYLIYQKKDYDEAIKQAKQALKLMDFSMAHYKLSIAYYKKAAKLQWKEEKYKEAREYFLKSLEHNPSHVNSYYGLGMSYYHTGYDSKNKSEIVKAKHSLEKVLKLDPQHEEAQEYLPRLMKLYNWCCKGM